jgi:hypothetical protein
VRRFQCGTHESGDSYSVGSIHIQLTIAGNQTIDSQLYDFSNHQHGGVALPSTFESQIQAQTVYRACAT